MPIDRLDAIVAEVVEYELWEPGASSPDPDAAPRDPASSFLSRAADVVGRETSRLLPRGAARPGSGCTGRDGLSCSRAPDMAR